MVEQKQQSVDKNTLKHVLYLPVRKRGLLLLVVSETAGLDGVSKNTKHSGTAILRFAVSCKMRIMR